MRTTLEILDPISRRANVKAPERGIPVSRICDRSGKGQARFRRQGVGKTRDDGFQQAPQFAQGNEADQQHNRERVRAD